LRTLPYCIEDNEFCGEEANYAPAAPTLFSLDRDVCPSHESPRMEGGLRRFEEDLIFATCFLACRPRIPSIPLPRLQPSFSILTLNTCTADE